MPRTTKKASIAAAVGAATLALSAPLAAAGPAAAAASPAVLPSVVPGWAASAPVVGQTPSNQTVYLLFELRQKDPAGMAAYGRAATTPGDPLYRQWLGVDEFKARFGAVDGAAAAVTAGLGQLGITNVSVDKLGLSVLAPVPASVASSVLQVRFVQVRHDGKVVRVATNEPTLPAVLAPWVTTVDGLTEHQAHADHTATEAVADPEPALPTGGAPLAYNNAGPKSAYFGQLPATAQPAAPAGGAQAGTTRPYIVGGYTPAQLRGAYGLDPVNGTGGIPQTGKGVKVGVVLWYDGPDVASDLATYSKNYGLPAPDYTDISPENQVTTVAGAPAPVLSPADAAGEQTLDVEAIHTMAPDASIIYSGGLAPFDETVFPAEDAAMAAGAEVLNNSWGGTGDTDAANAAAFAESVTGPALTLGVGIDFSSGDAADNVTANGVREADFPSTSDQVTSVGGTGLEVGSDNSYQGEFYWGTYSAPLSADGKSWGPIASQAGGAGGGGGLSTAYPEPTWQQGVVPSTEAANADTVDSYTTANGAAPAYGTTAAPGRVVPDISLLADSTTGFLVGETQQPDANADGSYPSTSATYSTYRIGGTSVSSPLFTGLMADVDQALGKSAGFANPTMYAFPASGSAFRDPSVGGVSRAGDTMAQVLATPVGSRYAGADGTPGLTPVMSEVRPDYTDSGNAGYATATYDPVTGLIQTGATKGGNAVVYHLREQGVLGTLESRPGYDDSTGLGTPYAPAFVGSFVTAAKGGPTPALPEAPIPAALVVGGGLLGLGVWRRRRAARA